MYDQIFIQLSIVFAIALLVGLLTNVLRQPLIISYIIAGICAGPLLFNVVSTEAVWFSFFSKLGVILLMFVIGLGLNFNYIKKIGRTALIIGLAQAFITAGLGVVLLRLLGFDWWPAGYLAIATTFSSTIIVTKLLGDKKHLDSLYGRHVIGILLVQDAVAIALMAVLIAGGRESNLGIVTILWALIAKGAIAVVAMWFLTRYILPYALHYISKSAEFLFLFSLTWCFVVASLAGMLGISYEIGAILAGISLGSSVYQPEISSRIRPLRDFFLIIFFVLLGAQVNAGNFIAALGPSIILSVFILLGDSVILYLLFRVLHFTRKNSFLGGLTATQVSEFGFVLLYLGLSLGKISGTDLTIFTVAGLITIFISSYLIKYNERVYFLFAPLLNIFGHDKYRQEEEIVKIYDVWVIGYHRIGWKIVDVLKRQKVNFAVVDFNPEVVNELRHQGVPVYFGDISDVEFIASIPLEKSGLIISTLPDPEMQTVFIKHVRKNSKGISIIANAPQAKDREWLYAAGADYVMTTHLLGGELLATLLHGNNIDKADLEKLRAQQKLDAQSGMPIENL
ncbi:MAG: hypothetical protein A2538_04470 [Candidatus Magasanikbacteria bacterium RIFOXYD2_FULL_41_14]|uniref:Uncharacterized protein n=1 Tax=Candidatus Magasanikbacteria bacterium RIFOXYD2_FULL_41_14 TaxID=1798709 RepID=A0A1F6PES4_9BACT|nr:MAG: hypothetical protein A2538_04470 [Candidatus Magasanikbacteria bacterium RIFOXYD2_FULL_41_14]